MRNILISPIKAVIIGIPSSMSFYVLCSSYNWGIRMSNAIELRFFDTIDGSNIFAFTPARASSVLEFFLSTPRNVDIFICCDSGESRSSAIAAALKRYQGESDLEIWNNQEYHPNILVYDICCESFGLNNRSAFSERQQ